jgi:hypothetical protein
MVDDQLIIQKGVLASVEQAKTFYYNPTIMAIKQGRMIG